MIYGSGELSICAELENLTSFGTILIPPCYASFSFEVSTDTAEATYLNPSGIVQTREAGIVSEKYILSLEIQDVDYTALQLAMGELSIITNGIDLLEQETVTLQSTILTDTRISGSSSARVAVYNLTERQIMKKLTSSPSNTNEYFVDGTNKRIEFAPNQVGQTVSIKFLNENQTQGCIGGLDNTGEFYRFSFSGYFFTTSGDGPYALEISDLRRMNAPTITSNGDVSIINLEFQAVCGDNDDNARKPFRMYSPNIGINLNELCYLLEDESEILLEDSSGCILLENSP